MRGGAKECSYASVAAAEKACGHPAFVECIMIEQHYSIDTHPEYCAVIIVQAVRSESLRQQKTEVYVRMRIEEDEKPPSRPAHQEIGDRLQEKIMEQILKNMFDWR